MTAKSEKVTLVLENPSNFINFKGLAGPAGDARAQLKCVGKAVMLLGQAQQCVGKAVMLLGQAQLLAEDSE